MFDSILLASYGGPESVEEIDPFLNAVLDGKRVPQERRDLARARYLRFGGVSPLRGEARALAELLAKETEKTGVRVYSAFLYGSPSFSDALEALERNGARNLLTVFGSAFGSAASCPRYRRAFDAAFRARTPDFQSSLKVAFTPPFYDLDAFKRAQADAILEALAWDELESNPFENAATPERLILFTAHSIPSNYGEESRYRDQLVAAADGIVARLLDAPANGVVASLRPVSELARPFGPPPLRSTFDKNLIEGLRKLSLDAAIAFQSRSGSPREPWLEPDIRAFLKEYRQKRPEVRRVVFAPIGFFFENLETIYDLDVEARAICEELDLKYRRARCVGATERIARAIANLASLENDAFPACPTRDARCRFDCRK